eukprot:TRINITY_DN64013_c0_g1_i1.p1 TRINITY_DN64013_c0_g1~~TRINITY_DN64013_c0_g1_i1.p1  ORF type:complete len:1076 (-),score=227.82 TRINITY_DN64013_c0_g1_i1:45-3272(-)
MADTVGQVVGHIHGLHRDFANTKAHSEWLTRFQQAQEAWGVVHSLLTSQTEEVVLHFASHTIVSKLQAGQLPPDANACRNQLLSCLARFRSGPASVRRQLVIALVDCQLWQPAAEDSQWLSDSVRQLSEGGADAVPCLLELLAVIPEEAANRKVMVPGQRRSSFAQSMLLHTQMVLDALCTAAQASEASAVAALRACARWLHLQHASPALRAQKKAANSGGGKFCADIVRQGLLQDNPLLRRAAQVLTGIGGSQSVSLELCRACADLLSEAQALTNEATGPSGQLVLTVMETVVAACQQLLPLTQANLERWMEQDSELVSRVAVVGRLVSELGGPFARVVVADGSGAPGGAVLTALSDVAQHLVRLRHTDLARCGLDFWYQALSAHLGAESQEDDPYDEDGAASGRPGDQAWAARDPELESQRRQLERPLLKPHIEKMVQAHYQAVRYPPEPELEANFEWDDFVRFREICSINITEACLIVTPQWIIQYIGQVLEETCQRSPIPWQDIDACVFVLTGVASRAPAGQDTVIPKLIELLPQLPYPTEGFKALLLRGAASRLVLFTSGYLALNPGPCKEILRFLSMQHLPAIPPLQQAPDPDAKKYAEAMACDAMKMVMTAARKTIVAAEGGTLWKDVVSAVINLVMDTRFNVDCRAQLVFGIGQVLSVLQDWSELEQMLSIFVTRMEGPIQPLLSALPAEPLGSRAVKTTRDGKAPVELKLYIASVSSVYNMPSRDPSLPRADHHPVLAVVEKHFATIERVCLHHTQYEELMEQVCLAFSYILGFSREYVPTSPIFVPMMKLMAKCCEQHPQPYYMGLIRSVIGFFAAQANNDLDAILIDLTGLFIAPVARNLSAAPGSGVQPMPPPITGSAYEMMAEAVRHWNLSLKGIVNTQWLPEVLDCTIEALPRLTEEGQAVYERTITAMLRFVRNVLLWGDPETSKGDNAPELLELQKQAQAVMSDRQLPRGVALPRLVSALARLLAAAAAYNPSRGEVVPSVAEVYRTLLIGPFEYTASQQIPAALKSLPGPLGASLVGEHEPQRLLQQLKMEKRDIRRFTKTIVSVAEQFAMALKKTQA